MSTAVSCRVTTMSPASMCDMEPETSTSLTVASLTTMSMASILHMGEEAETFLGELIL